MDGHNYEAGRIEAKWRGYWERHGTNRSLGPGDEGFEEGKPKYYVLAMFPYPSGAGMHMGHALNYTSTDIVARFKMLRGFNVLHPIGFDAFGLPAEQYAVEHGVHPRITTEKNIEGISAQLKRLGLSFDWDRCVSTTDVGYYRWTQWIFLKLYESWFDERVGAARPISELVRMLENEEMYVGVSGELVDGGPEGMEAITGEPIGAVRWMELSGEERESVLAGHRLAFMDEVAVNWCPALGTVLANEEVTAEGRSERGNHPVFKRPLKQWMLRITRYCERLIDDLEVVDWPEPIKLMQRNWIGRSEGAEVEFQLESVEDSVTVFTTRPDTLFGATYMVLAPEHPLVDEVTTADRSDEVARYVKRAGERGEAERMEDGKEKTGVFTGAYAINPANGERVPIWIADYVMMGYGTGAIMAVPAHDVRDYEFATKFDISIKAVVMPDDEWLCERTGTAGFDVDDAAGLRFGYEHEPTRFGEAFTGHGVAINSENSAVSLNGLETGEAKGRMIRWLEDSVNGKGKVQYKLRDWLFSRQRYWGEPFPILHGEDGLTVAVDEGELPVELPEMEDFAPEPLEDPDAAPRPPLGRADESWRVVEKDGKLYGRELNTMPQWAGSCWYYLRFLDPRNGERFVGEDAEHYWMGERGVDLYIGGVEHAVLHLLYARFWHKVLFDLEFVGSVEPFGRLFNQGYIQAAAFTDKRGVYVEASEVEERAGESAKFTRKEPKGKDSEELVDVEYETTHYWKGEPVVREFGKMGKSLKNSVSPDEVAEVYGVDTLRLYLMYLGPLEASKPWNDRDIVGVNRFLKRVWRNVVDVESGELLLSEGPAGEGLRRMLHRTIKRVTEDMERLAFNTAIAALIELNNELVGMERVPREAAEVLVKMLWPLAPHISEELYERMGHEEEGAWGLRNERWPEWDEKYLVEDELEIVVQVMGKVRGKIKVASDADEDAIKAAALAEEKVIGAIGGKTVRKVIVVKGKIVNVVVG